MTRERINKRLAALSLLLLFAATSFAQSDDWGLWTSLAVDKKLTKEWMIKPGIEYRLKEDFSQTDQLRGSLDVGYKPFKFLKFGAGYELIADRKPKKEIYAYRNRFKLEATASYKIDRFTLSWRPRLQLTHYNKVELTKSDPDDLKWALRNRFGLQYNIKKLPLKPYAQFETFHRLFSDLEPGYFGRRFAAGVEYSITKQHEIDLGYKQDTERFTGVNYHMNVVAVGYKFSF